MRTLIPILFTLFTLTVAAAAQEASERVRPVQGRGVDPAAERWVVDLDETQRQFGLVDEAYVGLLNAFEDRVGEIKEATERYNEDSTPEAFAHLVLIASRGTRDLEQGADALAGQWEALGETIKADSAQALNVLTGLDKELTGVQRQIDGRSEELAKIEREAATYAREAQSSGEGIDRAEETQLLERFENATRVTSARRRAELERQKLKLRRESQDADLALLGRQRARAIELWAEADGMSMELNLLGADLEARMRRGEIAEAGGRLAGIDARAGRLASGRDDMRRILGDLFSDTERDAPPLDETAPTSLDTWVAGLLAEPATEGPVAKGDR